MEKRLFEHAREVHPSQMAVLIFMLSITYKIVMLPRYLSQGAPRDMFIGMACAMAIECVMYVIVYRVLTYSNVYDMYPQKWISTLIFSAVIFSSMTKFLVLSVETLDYISTMLFQEGRWLFIILTLMPALGYIAFKGSNTIARLGEIVIWLVVASFLFTIFFMKADMELDNILPLFDGGVQPVVDTMMRHSMWFGDYVPLIVLTLSKRRSRLDKVAIPLSFVLTYVVTMGFYLLFIALYGDVAPYIKYAFSNIGIYNSISNLLGGVDFPIVCVWLLMAIVKLALLLYSVTHSIGYIMGKHEDRRWSIAIVVLVTLVIMLILSFGVDGVHDIYDVATGPLRYGVLAVDLILPIILLVTMLVLKRQYR